MIHINRKGFELVQSTKSRLQIAVDGWIGTSIARLCEAISLINLCFSSGTGCLAEPLVGTLAGKSKISITGKPCLAEEAIGVIDDAMLT